MKRRRFVQLSSILLFLTTCKDKFSLVSEKNTDLTYCENTSWPLTSYPNVPSSAGASNNHSSIYEARGIGGGGAYCAYSISPFNELRFVGTDMETLFRSADGGKTWYPVDHREAMFSDSELLPSEIVHTPSLAFAPDGNTVYYAFGGAYLEKKPRRSKDQGLTFNVMNVPLQAGEEIKYFTIDRYNSCLVLCGTSESLLYSPNQGDDWYSFQDKILGKATGTFVDYQDGQQVIYHATEKAIFRLTNSGKEIKVVHSQLSADIRIFTGGRDGENGLTLVFVDSDVVNAVITVSQYPQGNEHGTIDFTKGYGFLWIYTGKLDNAQPTFQKQQDMGGGRHLCMAANNSQVIYTTGGQGSSTQQGNKVWKGTYDKSKGIWNWDIVFLEYEHTLQGQGPFKPWPKENLEYSAPGLDIGWNDDLFWSFSVNLLDANDIGGTTNYFLLTSNNGGLNWKSPFTQYAQGVIDREPQQRWKSTGMENTSILRFKFHPNVPTLAYAAVSDMGGFVTEDGGNTFQITKALKENYSGLQYDYAFDEEKSNIVYAAAGNDHDWPDNGHIGCTSPEISNGGVFRSDDRGKTWERLTTATVEKASPDPFDMQFLCVAYQKELDRLLAGSQGSGIALCLDQKQKKWTWVNRGLPHFNFTVTKEDENQVEHKYLTGGLIVSQLEIDPINGDVYCLVSGNAGNPKKDPDSFKNFSETGIYFLSKADLKNLPPEKLKWKRLGNPNPDSVIRWKYPTAFTVDWKTKTLWLVDMGVDGSEWLSTGIWRSTNNGKNWEIVQPFTKPRHILVDPSNSNKIYVNGRWELRPDDKDNSLGNNGYGGAFHSFDGGNKCTWFRNKALPLLQNGRGTVLDPNNPNRLFYTFFGGGFLYGERPNGQNTKNYELIKPNGC